MKHLSLPLLNLILCACLVATLAALNQDWRGPQVVGVHEQYEWEQRAPNWKVGNRVAAYAEVKWQDGSISFLKITPDARWRQWDHKPDFVEE